jgi:hypothetical protein
MIEQKDDWCIGREELDTLSSSYTETPEEVLQQYLDGIEYHIEQGMVSRSFLEKLNKLSVRKLNETLSDGTKKEYLNLEQGTEAYSKILDTGITAQEALEYVAECYGKSPEWVEEVKGNNYLHASKVVAHHKHHPVQKAMLKDGSMRTKALKTSKTPNHQLRELYAQRKLHTTLTQLKTNTESLTGEVEGLKAQTIITDVNVDTVLDLLGLDHLTNKDKASKLKAKGITQKKVAEYLDVPFRTVKSWWPKL